MEQPGREQYAHQEGMTMILDVRGKIYHRLHNEMINAQKYVIHSAGFFQTLNMVTRTAGTL